MSSDVRAIRLVALATFALCALVTKSHVTSWNDGSRFATIDSIANYHTFAIDRSSFTSNVGDEFHIAGHTYSDKPPALALLGAAVAVLLKQFGITFAQNRSLAIYLVTLLTIGPWFALGSAYAYAFARLLAVPRPVAAFAALSSVAGTLSLTYAGVLSNHVPAGAAALAAAYHLVRARTQPRDALAAGLFLSVSYAFDAAAAVMAIAAIIILWRAPVARWALVVCAALPIVTLQVLYNFYLVHTAEPVWMSTPMWSDPSTAFFQQDPMLLIHKSMADYLRYAAYLLIGDKGFFSYTPLMFLSVFGFYVMWRTGNSLQRRITVAIAVTSTVYFALILMFENDYLALNFGERRYVDLFPILCVSLGPALCALQRNLAKAASLAVIAVSIFAAALGTLVPFGGTPGQSGYTVALTAYAQLAAGSPAQATLDVVLLALLIAAMLRFAPFRMLPTSPGRRVPT